MNVMVDPALRGADLAHPYGQYGTVAKWFHWITVALMAVALPVGFVIQHIKDDHKMVFYAIHESAGVTIFLVALLRLGWRLTHKAPELPAEIPPPMRIAANAVHHALYTLLVLQPIFGFFATNAYGFPLRGQTAYLGFVQFPKFMDTNEALGGALLLVHTIFGWTILALLCAHIGAAVFHHAIRRDGTLMRML